MSNAKAQNQVPSYLETYRETYLTNPRQANLDWFKDSGYGLFMHYGLYSVLGHGEWAMYIEKIPLAEYEKLKDQFTAENFDADKITEMVLASGMKYITITTRHHDSFCLFRTSQTDYNSVNSPAKRDLIAELAVACEKKKIGLFLYYSYAADWRHPYFFAREAGSDIARPDYATPEPRYLWKKDEDFKHYINFVHAQLRELLTQYGPIAGMWFDPMMVYYQRPDLFPIKETYALIRSLQPQCLIAFKQGACGEEDFAAPERNSQSLADRLKGDAADLATRVWEANKNKHKEICDTLQPFFWGYKKDNDGKHKKVNDVLGMLANAKSKKANLLLNTGPLPDGSIDLADQKTLLEVGKKLAQGDINWDRWLREYEKQNAKNEDHQEEDDLKSLVVE